MTYRLETRVGDRISIQIDRARMWPQGRVAYRVVGIPFHHKRIKTTVAAIVDPDRTASGGSGSVEGHRVVSLCSVDRQVVHGAYKLHLKGIVAFSAGDAHIARVLDRDRVQKREAPNFEPC